MYMAVTRINAVYDVKDGFYKLQEKDRARYKSLLNQPNSSTDAKKIIQQIHMIKARAMIRITKETLNKVIYDDQGRQIINKVILVIEYPNVIRFLLKKLKEFNPLEVYQFDKFNESNGNHCLLIANINLCYGVPLYDNTGLFPRFMFIMPMLEESKCHLASSRLLKLGAFGTITVRYFYGISEINEKLILRSKINSVTPSTGTKCLFYYDEYENINISLVGLCFDIIIDNRIEIVNLPDDLLEKYNSLKI